MKKIILKTSIAFLLLFMMGAGCEKDCKTIPVNGSTDNVTGKWKQIKAERIYSEKPPSVIDYSCDNIIYSFKGEANLAIESNRIDYLGHKEGQHDYEFHKSPYGQIYHILIIDGIQYSCTITEDNTMTVDLEPLPGPLGPTREFRTVLYFIRIQ